MSHAPGRLARLAALGAVLLLSLLARPSRADLLGDADAVLQSWRKLGASRRLATLFLGAGEVRTLAVGLRATADKPCATLLFLAPRALRFAVKAKREHKSSAGLVRLSRCGSAGGALFDKVSIAMRSTRGAIEVLLSSGRSPAPAIGKILPGRAAGSGPGQGDLGRPLELPPLAERVARARAAARLDGATMVIAIPTSAADDGEGALLLKLRGGCHRLTVHAGAEGAAGPVDVDAEVRPHGAKQALWHDRSHAPDARLDFCVGATTQIELRYGGAGGKTAVTVLDAYWPYRAKLEPSFGARAQAGIAWALHRRRAPALSTPLVRLVGGAGNTEVTLGVERGACYVAAFALTRGAATASRIGVKIDGRLRHDDAMAPLESGAVAFCSLRDDAARLSIEMRGAGSEWLALLWRVGP